MYEKKWYNPISHFLADNITNIFQKYPSCIFTRPNSSFSKPYSRRLEKTLKAITSMSVSLVLINTFCPFSTLCLTCTNILVSVSSWLQGTRLFILWTICLNLWNDFKFGTLSKGFGILNCLLLRCLIWICCRSSRILKWMQSPTVTYKPEKLDSQVERSHLNHILLSGQI